MIVKALAQSSYALVGGTFLLLGVIVLLLGTGLLPEAVRTVVVDLAEGNPNTLHVLQEEGCLLVFLGIITFWFLRHYDQSRPFHWAMTVFWGLLALVHWFDTNGSFQPDAGQAILTIPFIFFLVIGLLRQRRETTIRSGVDA